ncbi:MAG: hypothetical protein IPF99_15570 [Deltaproteobacteria bacterium]|nr:hypothetical protein [Deltaproteobacteria bacterium]
MASRHSVGLVLVSATTSATPSTPTSRSPRRPSGSATRPGRGRAQNLSSGNTWCSTSASPR